MGDERMSTGSEVVEVCMTDGVHENVRIAAYPPAAAAGRIACHECDGSGWWGYGPTEDENGPCVVCKGTGREWVGLS